MSGQSRHVVLREKQATLEHHRHLDQSEACLNHEAVLLCRPRSSFSRAQDESHASGGHIGPLTPRCGYSRARGSPAGVRGWGTEGARTLGAPGRCDSGLRTQGAPGKGVAAMRPQASPPEEVLFLHRASAEHLLYACLCHLGLLENREAAIDVLGPASTQGLAVEMMPL